MLTTNFLQIPLSSIEVNREQRQRRKVDLQGLTDSISKWGLINPIVVERIGETDKYKLIAGERRLAAHKELKLEQISARLSTDLTSTERQILELEENIKRQDLEWKDFCSAVIKIHRIYQEIDSSWTQEKTADSISLEPGTLSIILRVAQELENGNKLLDEASNYRAAYNVISRRDSRKADDVFNDLMGGKDDSSSEARASKTQPSISNELQTENTDEPVHKSTPLSCIWNCDFLEWIHTYKGPPFSFLHCDFPYGIGLDKSDQGGSAAWGAYRDSEETYWKLVHCLTDNLDKLMAPSSHLMFWLSSDAYIISQTLAKFSVRAPSLTFNPKPLIWHKTDGKGILPDPNRGPRHVYETAIFASRGDRLIAQSVADCYGQPKGDAAHQSEKPEQMLRHYFRMFIDSGTSFLDPTCGSGTSLCAAESLGATVTGIEINEEWAEGARSKLRTSRLLRET